MTAAATSGAAFRTRFVDCHPVRMGWTPLGFVILLPIRRVEGSERDISRRGKRCIRCRSELACCPQDNPQYYPQYPQVAVENHV